MPVAFETVLTTFCMIDLLDGVCERDEREVKLNVEMK